ncbi:MAG: acyltransferase [Sphingobacteriales bacterium]|nr:MAG: acyltransferase [Sphingobacteriales bacterium]
MQQHNSQKFYGLDHLRALAIILVLLSHYNLLSHHKPDWLADVALFGWTGVDLFFCLSGFLISSQLFAQIKQGQPISFKTFFLKRFFRIIPAYLAVVAIYFTIPYFREKKGLADLWRFLTFTQNFGLDLSKTKAFTHSWSLCVEEHFYLALPLILIFFQKINGIKKAYWLLLFLFLMGFATRIYGYEHFFEPVSEKPGSWPVWYEYVYYPTYNRLDGLLTGVSIAAIYTFLPGLWARLSKRSNWFVLLGLLLLTGAWFLCEDQMTFEASAFGFPLVSLGYGCLVVAALSPSNFLYKWKSNVTTFIATLSYAIYLTHKGVIHMTELWFEKYELDPHIMMLITLITCTSFALILHWVIEKPFMKLRNRVVDKKKL